jgi:hypothetical protein
MVASPPLHDGGLTAMSTGAERTATQEAGTQPQVAPSSDAPLPKHLIGLVNPDVWTRSEQRVAEKLGDRPTREACKQLYIRALADHLVRKVENANDSLDHAA